MIRLSLFFIDIQPPDCICPEDITTYTTNSSSLEIEWPEPSCSDNSGLECNIQLISPTDVGPVPPGLTKFTYQAMDNSNNTQNCSFNIDVKGNIFRFNILCYIIRGPDDLILKILNVGIMPTIIKILLESKYQAF